MKIKPEDFENAMKKAKAYRDRTEKERQKELYSEALFTSLAIIFAIFLLFFIDGESTGYCNNPRKCKQRSFGK